MLYDLIHCEKDWVSYNDLPILGETIGRHYEEHDFNKRLFRACSRWRLSTILQMVTLLDEHFFDYHSGYIGKKTIEGFARFLVRNNLQLKMKIKDVPLHVPQIKKLMFQ